MCVCIICIMMNVGAWQREMRTEHNDYKATKNDDCEG